MTETQFKKKIANMKKEVSEYIDKETLRLFKSGAVDTATYEGNYLLPKIILSVALYNLPNEYMPFTDESKKIVALLKHF